MLFRHFKIYDIHNTVQKRGGNLTITYIDDWKTSNSLHWPKFEISKFYRRRNFNGLNLLAVLTV